MTAEQLRLAALLLGAFRGRADHAAKGNPDGSFGPVKLRGPMQPEWLRKHFAGEVCAGFYLMTPESRVWCSCADFDDHPDNPDPEWRDKAGRVYEWLVKAGVQPLAEVSQSGSGLHLWLFLDEETPAATVRDFWRLAGEQVGVPLREVYPRQDALAGKGLGNLVRYPLWNKSRFVDPEDDWADLDAAEALAGIRRTSGPEMKDLAFRLAGQKLREAAAPAPRPVAPAPAAAELPPRVRDRLRREHSLLARRWEGDTAGLGDPSRSALAQAIACELVRQYVPTPEIEAALRYWCGEQDYEKGLRDDWIARTVSKAYEFVLQRVESRSAGATAMRDACHAYIDTLEAGRPVHVASGIEELDRSVDGVAFGEMAIIAARPSHGKSAVALQWLDSASATGMPCLMVSEEMSSLELGKRGVMYASALPQEQWGPETADFLRVDVDRHYRGRAPVHVVENCNSVERCEDVIDQMCGVHGVRLVAVDYLQLLGSRGKGRYEQVTEISRRLKQCAKRNQCGLLAVCQLSREIDRRRVPDADRGIPGGRPANDFEPRMSDLKESGQLEQDADLIIFVQRMWLYDRQRYRENEYYLTIGKRRNGPIRSPRIVTTFDAPRQRVGCGPSRMPGEEG